MGVAAVPLAFNLAPLAIIKVEAEAPEPGIALIIVQVQLLKLYRL